MGDFRQLVQRTGLQKCRGRGEDNPPNTHHVSYQNREMSIDSLTDLVRLTPYVLHIQLARSQRIERNYPLNGNRLIEIMDIPYLVPIVRLYTELEPLFVEMTSSRFTNG